MRLAEFLILLLLPATTIAGPLLKISPSSPNGSIGFQTKLTLDISGLGVGAAPSLALYDLDLQFDPMFISIASVVFGDSVQGNQMSFFVPNFESSSVGFGTLNLSAISFDQESDIDMLQSGDFVLAELTLDLLQVGVTQLTLSGKDFKDAAFVDLPVTLQGTALTITPESLVPEPAYYLLTAGLLLGLALVKRSQSRQKRMIAALSTR